MCCWFVNPTVQSSKLRLIVFPTCVILSLLVFCLFLFSPIFLYLFSLSPFYFLKHLFMRHVIVICCYSDCYDYPQWALSLDSCMNASFPLQGCRCRPCSSTTPSYRGSTADAGRPGRSSPTRNCPAWRKDSRSSGICPRQREWSWPPRWACPRRRYERARTERNTRIKQKTNARTTKRSWI